MPKFKRTFLITDMAVDVTVEVPTVKTFDELSNQFETDSDTEYEIAIERASEKFYQWLDGVRTTYGFLTDSTIIEVQRGLTSEGIDIQEITEDAQV